MKYPYKMQGSYDRLPPAQVAFAKKKKLNHRKLPELELKTWQRFEQEKFDGRAGQ